MIFSTKLESPEKPTSEIKLIPILKSDQLLANLRNQPWLNKIKNSLSLPDAHFETLYVQLIEQFSEFVQILPTTTEGRLGTLLSESLARTILALRYFQESDDEKLQLDPRYAYALFSASLFLQIGHITNSKVTIADGAGHFVADWSPYQGSLIKRKGGEYYKIHRYGQVPAHLQRYVAPLLARQLMPEAAFLWLTEDVRLFHMWLSLLNDDRANAGSLEFILTIPLEEIENLLASEPLVLPIHEVEFVPQSREMQEAENFLHWLQVEVEKGHIATNTPDADIIVLTEGVFISMDLFRQFCSAFSGQHYTVLVKAFNHLGLTELSGSDFKFLQYFEKSSFEKKHKIDFKTEASKGPLGFLNQKKELSASTSKIEQTGVLLREADLLFKESIAPVSFAKISPASALSTKLPQLEGSPLNLELTAKLS